MLLQPYQLQGDFGGVVTSCAKAFIFKCEQTWIIVAQCNNTCCISSSACCDVFLLPESGRHAACNDFAFNLTDNALTDYREVQPKENDDSFLLLKSLSLFLALFCCFQSTLYALAANACPPLGNCSVTHCHTELLRSSGLIPLAQDWGSGVTDSHSQRSLFTAPFMSAC